MRVKVNEGCGGEGASVPPLRLSTLTRLAYARQHRLRDRRGMGRLELHSREAVGAVSDEGGEAARGGGDLGELRLG